MSKKSSQNSIDKELDLLEDEFLKCEIGEIPIPKKELIEYESDVKEVMKSGCNRQIAEYVILKYKNLEDEEKKKEKEEKEKEEKEKEEKEKEEKEKEVKEKEVKEKEVKEKEVKEKEVKEKEVKEKEVKEKEFKSLPQLRKEYNNYKKPMIQKAIESIVENITKNKDDYKNEKIEMEGYEDELDEILNSEKINDLKKDDKIKKEVNLADLARFYVNKYLTSLNEDEEKKFQESRKKYYDKRDAVIEFALREVKKIVNDQKEYEKFYKEYYGKDEPKDDEK